MFRMFIKIKNIFEFVFFSHVGPLIKYGRKNIISKDDMMALPSFLNPKDVPLAMLDVSLKGAVDFIWTTLKLIKKHLYVIAGLLTAMFVLEISSPLIIRMLILDVESALRHEISLWQGIGVSVMLAVVNLSTAVVVQHYIYQIIMTEQLIKNYLNFRIYEQALKITRKARQDSVIGELVNHMSVDADAVARAHWLTAEFIYSVVMVTGVSLLLFKFLGWAAFASIGLLILISPVTGYLGKKFMKYDEEIKDWRDKRVSFISQVVTGIRIVKYFTWERKITDRFRSLRDHELGSRRKKAIVNAFSSLIYLSSITLVCFAGFGCYVLLGNSLDAAILFPCIALFITLEHPIGNLTYILAELASAKVSAERLIRFFKQERKIEEEKLVSLNKNAVGISIREASAIYAEGSREAFKHVTLHIKAGESVAIVGPVGSGKTSLLLSIIDELPLCLGTITFDRIGQTEYSEHPRIGFVPQEAFVLNASLRRNICFDENIPESELYDIIKETALDQDIKELSHGLETEVGENGINLSGGQKQRVGLARAAALNPQIVILDDPFSSVDDRTESILHERLVFGRWQEKTRIVVTHRLAHLDVYDTVVFMEEGAIKAVGQFSDLMKCSERFSLFYAEHTKLKISQDRVNDPLQDQNILKQDLNDTEDPRTRGGLTIEEDRETGIVKASVYWKYLQYIASTKNGDKKSCTIVLLLLLLTAFCATALPIILNAWLSVWSDRGKEQSHNLFAPLLQWIVREDLYNLKIYAIFVIILAIVYFGHSLLWALRALRGGLQIHETAFKGVLGTKIRFFDATPSGRILNRFSYDVDMVEGELTWSFEQMVRAFINTLNTIAIIVIVFPLLTFIMLPLLYFYYELQANYRASSREAKRLTSISKSPRFAHFKETLEGLSVIRCHRKEKMFWTRYFETLEEHQRMFYNMILINRWFSIRIPLVSAGITVGAGVMIMWLAQGNLIGAGIAGFSLIFIVKFWEHLNWCIRMFSEVESMMTSVERLLKFIGLEPEEKVSFNNISDKENDLKEWPKAGEVVFENVTAKYADHLPNILKGMSFKAPAGKKIGIMGRTGSGKSTMFQALYRFINVASGKIMIDGIDIATVPLEQLRKNMAIIPQDPTLFQGTLRENLDRFGFYSDQELHRVLKNVQLEDWYRALPKGLHSEVKEHGRNFSQGQRQLLCLARALLTDAKIILIDEATANVDMETDAVIQKAIKTACHDRTMLVIAHRLGTLKDCDQVISIEDGRVLV